MVQGVRVAGESLARVLRGETDGQLRGHKGLWGQCPAIVVPRRPQDTVTQPAPCAVVGGEDSRGGLLHHEQGQ